jgi:hypothetical protein
MICYPYTNLRPRSLILCVHMDLIYVCLNYFVCTRTPLRGKYWKRWWRWFDRIVLVTRPCDYIRFWNRCVLKPRAVFTQGSVLRRLCSRYSSYCPIIRVWLPQFIKRVYGKARCIIHCSIVARMVPYAAESNQTIAARRSELALVVPYENPLAVRAF